MKMMKMISCTYTNKGGRSINEDYLLEYQKNNLVIYTVCDGLGGHRNGAVASQLAAQTIVDAVKGKGIEALNEAFIAANDIILNHQLPENGKMKTTAVVLAVEESRVIWGHIGDSRLYRISKGEIELLTQDHSVSYKKHVSGDISLDDINFDEDRSSLLQALGNEDRHQATVLDVPETLHPGDAYLLCTDGFWEYLYCDEILIDFLKSDCPSSWMKHMLLRHLKRSQSDNDNFSAIAIYVSE